MPTVGTAPAIHTTTVLDAAELASGVFVLGFHAPDLVAAVNPGQFVMVVPPRGELAATALGVYEAQGERASVMFVACGPRTRELAALRPGATLEMFGPLGNGFALDAAPARVAVVSGGLGLASLLLPAAALLARGSQVSLYYGARTAALLVDGDRFERAGASVHYATDDGSRGRRGFVTDLLRAAQPRPDAIIACGPTPMLRATARVALELEIPAQLSLEENFGCGVGACWGCVVPIDRASAQAYVYPKAEGERREHAFARVCKEGPVFWAHELRWGAQ